MKDILQNKSHVLDQFMKFKKEGRGLVDKATCNYCLKPKSS